MRLFDSNLQSRGNSWKFVGGNGDALDLELALIMYHRFPLLIMSVVMGIISDMKLQSWMKTPLVHDIIVRSPESSRSLTEDVLCDQADQTFSL